MQTDAHFTIGHAHFTSGKPCQDYADSAELPDSAAYAIVADGCSSGGHTDIGSRVVTRATAQSIRENWTTVRLPAEPSTPATIALGQKVVMSAAQSMLGCSTNDMLATCLYVYAGPETGIINVQGDGAAAWQFADGRIVMVRLEWDNNTPFYPAYAADSYAGFIAAHGDDLNAEVLSLEWYETTWEGPRALPSTRATLAQGIQGIRFEIPVTELVQGAVFTDGISQIENLEWHQAVAELLAFKTTLGAFAKRRLARVVKDAKQRGNGPVDDLAYAVVRFDREE